MKWYHKECYVCREIKHHDEFPIKQSSRDGFYSYCRDCVSKRNRDLYLQNKEKFIDKAKTWQDQNKHKHVLSARYHARRKRTEDFN